MAATCRRRPQVTSRRISQPPFCIQYTKASFTRKRRCVNMSDCILCASEGANLMEEAMARQALYPYEGVRFGPRRLGHANLWVGDVHRNTEYYNKVFGLHLEATEPGILGSFLGNGNTHHDIGTVQITRGEDRLGRDGQ